MGNSRKLSLCLMIAGALLSSGGCSRDRNARKQKYFESGQQYFESSLPDTFPLESTAVRSQSISVFEHSCRGYSHHSTRERLRALSTNSTCGSFPYHSLRPPGGRRRNRARNPRCIVGARSPYQSETTEIMN